jgi:hypothetical protein
MSRHRYPPRALLGDYARAALGLALTSPPLLLVRMAPVAAAIVALLAGLFALFALATMLRQLGTVILDEGGIAVSGGWSRRIDWQDLRRVRLSWFAARRDRSSGFMQLVVAGGGRRIAVDSRIADFEIIAAVAADAAAARGLALNDTTLANLAALGVAAGTGRTAAAAD